MSSMYAVYHGPKNIISIANRVQNLCSNLAISLDHADIKILHNQFFDTLRILPNNKWEIAAENEKMNFRKFKDGSVGISLDESTTEKDVLKICKIFNADYLPTKNIYNLADSLKRVAPFLDHEVFNKYHSETEMLRYIHKLEIKDLSLNNSMIPLGSCTMKLNATTEMIPVTWQNFCDIHPFSPVEQTKGYSKLIDELSNWLSRLTGFDSCSMQPNSGAQGEYAGLLVIRAYHLKNGDAHRNICLVPESAHGTNPASAIMAGMKVEIVSCDSNGNINLNELKEKSEKHSNNLSAIMLTYPSTHGVFEKDIEEACEIVHRNGGQVYIDGANLNAMVGLCKPGEFGGDVMHINLHKTFCIPHGGGGPGMGPIVCKNHLKEFLPSHVIYEKTKDSAGAVSASPFGSSSILVISWAYIAMLNSLGLQLATKLAILNANYMAKRLEGHYPILFKGESGFNAHEFIIDLREIKNQYGVTEEDIAKRLMDYGYHAPTMSWPVNGTMMIEPTESESKEEIDRFCEALISIKDEILKIADGRYHQSDNPLKNAPHTATNIASDNWPHRYSRNEAVYPANHLKTHKYWPPVGRIDNAFGDRNLICTCLPASEYSD
jgi:glycine dehydrogenase